MTQQDRDLQEFVQTRSPEAFARLVDRYIDVVHSAATRQVRNSETAQDVTQAVFLVLAQKAGNVRPGQPLAAWLLQVTRYAAANARRETDRRNHHERRAGEMALRQAATQQHDRPDDFSWDELSPLLDEGMCKLRAKDRDVLVLRYFDKKSAREAGEALGISADAAEKRTTRAVAKLRQFFQRRGITVSGIALAAGLTARSAEAAPAALKPLVTAATSSSIAAPAAAGAIAKGTVIAMATAKTTSLIAAVAAILVVGGGGVVAYKTLVSPGARQVQVNVPSESADATTMPFAIVASVASLAPAALTFSDGSTMELVGITDTSDPAKKWWSADGSITPAVKTLRNTTMGMPPMRGMRTCQLVFRRSQALKDDSVSVSLAGPYRFSSGGGDDKEQDCTFGVDAKLAKTDVIVSVASGPWTVTERYPVKSGVIQTLAPEPATTPAATAPAAATRPSLQIQSLADRIVRSQKLAVLTVHRASRDTEQQQEIYLITTAGQEVRSVGSTGRQGGISEYNFKVPANEVAAVVARSRPYEIRKIRDVSLRPGVRTTPTTMPVR